MAEFLLLTTCSLFTATTVEVVHRGSVVASADVIVQTTTSPVKCVPDDTKHHTNEHGTVEVGELNPKYVRLIVFASTKTMKGHKEIVVVNGAFPPTVVVDLIRLVER